MSIDTPLDPDEVPSLIRPTLQRLCVNTPRALLAIDFNALRATRGVGREKLRVIEALAAAASERFPEAKRAEIAPLAEPALGARPVLDEVASLIRPLLKRLGVRTIGDLAAVDLITVRTEAGAGAVKWSMIRDAVAQARATLQLPGPLTTKLAGSPVGGAEWRDHVHLPKALAAALDRAGVTTIEALAAVLDAGRVPEDTDDVFSTLSEGTIRRVADELRGSQLAAPEDSAAHLDEEEGRPRTFKALYEAILASIPERDRLPLLVRARGGSLLEAGEAVGVSREYARQRIAKAVGSVSAPLRRAAEALVRPVEAVLAGCVARVEDVLTAHDLDALEPLGVAFLVLDRVPPHVREGMITLEAGALDKLRVRLLGQLYKAAFRGCTLDELDTDGVLVDRPALVQFVGALLRDEAVVFEGGRFRRADAVQTRGDRYAAILFEAGRPLTLSELSDRAKDSEAHQSVVVKALTRHVEIVQVDRGTYAHRALYGWSVADVARLLTSCAELLRGEADAVEPELLLELAAEGGFSLPGLNRFSIVSLVAQHPDLDRIVGDRLVHRSSLDTSKLSLASLHPGLANEWHPTENGSVGPGDIRPFSGRTFAWRCAKGHTWRMPVYLRTLTGRGCPGCRERWDAGKVRHFVASLAPVLQTLSPAERWVVFQQSGFLETEGKARGFARAIAAGKLPREELERFCKGEPSAADAFLGGETAPVDREQDEIADGLRETGVGASADADDALPIVSTREALKALSQVEASIAADEEAAAFFVASATAKLWAHAFRDEVAAVREAESFLCGFEGPAGAPAEARESYATRVRDSFLSEHAAALALPIPPGYSFHVAGVPAPPNLMQRLVAVRLLRDRRFGNWSGTGAGKTLSAILASRVCDASLSVICCPNAVVENWAREIRKVFPDSHVATKAWDPRWPPGKAPRYLVMNYEQFQQSDSEGRLRAFLQLHAVDFIVIDEIHYAKQRDAEGMTRRKRLVMGLVSAAGAAPGTGERLRVLGMSATPVINTLHEGRSLVELVTGTVHDDLDCRPTVANCMRLYQRLVTLGTRWKPDYAPQLETRVVDVDCSHALDRIRALGPRHSPLDLEQILTEVRLPVILDQLRPPKKTLLYSLYVDGIDRALYEAITAQGLRAGFYTGADKAGLQAFLDGNLDVLIGSSAIGTGVDGLQRVCDQIVVNVLPWTAAEYEQLVGRVYRQGQRAEKVTVVIPRTYAVVGGERWSYCESKLQRIRYKKSVADAAVDGVVPDGNLRSPAQVQQDLLGWLERLATGAVQAPERPRIVVPLSDAGAARRFARFGEFSTMNARWNTSRSETLAARLASDPEEWAHYHTLYRKARESWAVVPFEEVAAWAQRREPLVIGDFGCGEALLATRLAGRHVVHSFDHVAIRDEVIAGDMAHTPLEDESLDVAVFSLSLMGANFTDYLREAWRALALDGVLHVWEATSRFSDLEGFVAGLRRLGFKVFPPEERGGFTHFEARKTERRPEEGELRF